MSYHQHAPIGLFFGSTTGNTEDIAALIAGYIGYERVQQYNIAVTGLADISAHRYLIFGIPTWDFGELQEDWQDLWQELEHFDLTGCRCAIFGLGDQIGYAEWFLDAMGLLHNKLQQQGAQMVGYWPNQGYNFDESKALTPDGRQFVGLALDEDSQHAETEERVALWVPQVLTEFGLDSEGS